MTRAWFLALPAFTALVVAYSLFVLGAPRAIAFARVYGGPTEGLDRLSLRVEISMRDGPYERAYSEAAIRVAARALGQPKVEARGTTSNDGIRDFDLKFSRAMHGPLDLEISSVSYPVLARGFVSLDPSRWAERARRRGSWIRSRDMGGVRIAIAPGRGAFVVGFVDPLLIRVENGGQAVPNAHLSVSADGARLEVEHELKTDHAGRARIGFEAFDLNPTLRVEVLTGEGEKATVDTGVPVVGGGFHYTQSGAESTVESATPRSRVFYSLVTDATRVTGGALTLTANDHGVLQSRLRLPPHSQPAWLVLSSDVDQNGVATIGWPVGESPEPLRTFDVADARLLDGSAAAFAREQRRHSRVRWLTALFVALMAALSALLLVQRVRASERNIALHLGNALSASESQKVAPARLVSLGIALLGIGIGFALLGLLVAARPH